MKKILLLLTFLCVIFGTFTGCHGEYIEEPKTGGIVLPECKVGTLYDAHELVGEYVPMPDGELLYGVCEDGGMRLHIHSDIGGLKDYESVLSEHWYESIPLTVSMNDRISTWIHPTGWRVAVYDNRRSSELRKMYGDEEYVYELRIAQIEYDEEVFPEYPASHRTLCVPEELMGESVEYPDALLPAGFPRLPLGAEFLRTEVNSRGLFIFALTTYEDMFTNMERIAERYHVSEEGCYSNEVGDYFYETEYPITVIEDGEEMTDEQKAMGTCFYRSQLPKREADDGQYCMLVLQVVRYEWLPEWWRER